MTSGASASFCRLAGFESWINRPPHHQMEGQAISRRAYVFWWCIGITLVLFIAARMIDGPLRSCLCEGKGWRAIANALNTAAKKFPSPTSRRHPRPRFGKQRRTGCRWPPPRVTSDLVKKHSPRSARTRHARSRIRPGTTSWQETALRKAVEAGKQGHPAGCARRGECRPPARAPKGTHQGSRPATHARRRP